MTRRPKFACRTCGRGFGSLVLFDAHLGSDAELDRGIRARLRGEPSTEGHHDPKGGILDQYGIWRLPSPEEGSFINPSAAGGLFAGLSGDEQDA